MLGPLGADVFIGLSEEEQSRRHIANVEAPSDKDVNLSIQSDSKYKLPSIICDQRLRRRLESKEGRM